MLHLHFVNSHTFYGFIWMDKAYSILEHDIQMIVDYQRMGMMLFRIFMDPRRMVGLQVNRVYITSVLQCEEVRVHLLRS
jgi:hypothetical protein